MSKEVKDCLKASVCWFLVFIIMIFCSVVTGIDGIFAFIGMFSLFASIVCLAIAPIISIKNKITNTNSYIAIKEKQILKKQEKRKQEEEAKKELLNKKEETLKLEAETLIVQARAEMASTLLEKYANIDKDYLSKEKRESKKIEIKNMLVEQLDSLREDLERLNSYNVDNETKEKIVCNLKVIVTEMIDKLEDAIYYIEEEEEMK